MITSFYRAGTRSCLRRSMRSCLPTDIFARSLSTGQNNKKESRFDRFKHDIQDKIHDVEENISKKREELRDRAAHMKEEFERDANIMMAAAHIEMDAKKEEIKKKIEENADKLRQNAEDKMNKIVERKRERVKKISEKLDVVMKYVFKRDEHGRTKVSKKIAKFFTPYTIFLEDYGKFFTLYYSGLVYGGTFITYKGFVGMGVDPGSIPIPYFPWAMDHVQSGLQSVLDREFVQNFAEYIGVDIGFGNRAKLGVAAIVINKMLKPFYFMYSYKTTPRLYRLMYGPIDE